MISLIYDEFSSQKYTSFCWNSNYYLTACFLFLGSIYNLRKNIIILANTLKTDSIIKYSEKLVKFAILLIISMISSLVNVSIVIVESLGSEALVYYLEIIIQFLDLLSIPPLILIFNFGKLNGWTLLKLSAVKISLLQYLWNKQKRINNQINHMTLL